MKNRLLHLSLFGLLFLLPVGCEKELSENNTSERQAYETKSSKVEEQYTVSKDDVTSLLSNQKNLSEIIAYPSEDSPLLYIAKCNPGFFIISADRRAEPIVAYSFSEDTDADLEIAKYALEEFSLPVKSIISQPILTQAMRDNLDVWDRICTRGHSLREQNRMTYYYLIHSEDVIVTTSSIGPLLQTSWGQSNHYDNDHYWNECCPWAYSSCTGPKCPAGCVAVAGGQFAYAIKDNIGISVSMPTSASCSGYAPSPNYLQSFSTTFSTTMIDSMPMNYSCTDSSKIENARVFLAYIGDRVDMTYNATRSSSSISRLPSLFTEWGISSSYQSFDQSQTMTQLMNSVPVIVRGNNSDGNDGHAWLIDGYQNSYVLRRNWYYISETQLTEEQIAALTMDDWNGGYDEWIVSLPSPKFHMNWGWSGSYNGWYSTSNWTAAGLDFNSGKYMIKIN